MNIFYYELDNNTTYEGGSMNDISRNYGYKSVEIWR